MSDDGHNPITFLGELRACRNRPVLRPGVVLVCVNRRGQLVTAGVGVPLRTGTWIAGRSWEVYEVDIGERWLQFSAELPCKDNVGKFLAQVRLAYCVSDAVEVVRRWINDPRAEIEPWVEAHMSRHTCSRDTFDRAEAERAINHELGSRPQPVHDVGLRICRFYARLDLDQLTRGHVDRLMGIERETEADTREHALYQQRMSRYKEFMADGHDALVMLQLARQPQDLSAVLRMLKQEDAATRDRLLATFRSWVDPEALERHDVDPTLKAVMRRVMDEFEASLRPGSFNAEAPQSPSEAENTPDDPDDGLWTGDEDA